MTDAIHCQEPVGTCRLPRRFTITYRTAPLAGRHSGPGLEFVVALCGSHRDRCCDDVRKAGGEIVAVEQLPEPPTPALPEPIGLDALAPVSSGPAKQRRTRARSARKGTP